MSYNILVVEDDFEIARIIREHLSRGGYSVIWASTGNEGLYEFKKEKFDLVIIDLMLPEMNGFDLCKNIRLLSDIPILIASARKSDEDKVLGLNLGADDYITKPFSLIELEARVQSHIKRYIKFKNFNKKEENINFKKYNYGLLIDKNKKLVLIDNKRITLTAKEFELLNIFSNNPKKTFTKKELYEALWNQNDIDGNNTVTVHIKQLRYKLDENIKHPKFIETVWGMGYRFIGEEVL